MKKLLRWHRTISLQPPLVEGEPDRRNAISYFAGQDIGEHIAQKLYQLPDDRYDISVRVIIRKAKNEV